MGCDILYGSQIFSLLRFFFFRDVKMEGKYISTSYNFFSSFKLGFFFKKALFQRRKTFFFPIWQGDWRRILRRPATIEGHWIVFSLQLTKGARTKRKKSFSLRLQKQKETKLRKRHGFFQPFKGPFQGCCSCIQRVIFVVIHVRIPVSHSHWRKIFVLGNPQSIYLSLSSDEIWIAMSLIKNQLRQNSSGKTYDQRFACVISLCLFFFIWNFNKIPSFFSLFFVSRMEMTVAKKCATNCCPKNVFFLYVCVHLRKYW